MDPASPESIFIRALQVPDPVAREALLQQACAGDSALRHSVRSLLDAHHAGGDFLATTTPSLVPPAAGGHPTPNPADSLDAPRRAADFLRAFDSGGSATAATRLGSIDTPEGREACERIEAAFRVRSFAESAPDAPPPADPRRSSPDPAPPVLPGFTLEHPLGAGGLGIVYAARDEKLGRRVAIKLLRQGGGDGTARRRVLEEARKAACLDDPAIVKVFSVLDETEPPAIVMEYVEGFSIDRFAENLSQEQKARLLREVARGLATAHRHGVVHRDLKPDNVRVGPEMRPRILDFGLAVSLDEAGQRGRAFEGTPLYASPEQVLGRPLTTASDLFAFGSLMFKVLTGRPPFAGSSVPEVLQAIATTTPPFLRNFAVDLSEDLQAIVLACLAWNPADRPSAETVVLELGRFLSGEPVRLRPRLYEDLLRRRVSEHENEAAQWHAQGIISREERDQLQTLHRRLLADEDHWIIDARRLTLAQTVLYTSTWTVVVAAILLVWLARADLGAPWRWLAPLLATGSLLFLGLHAERRREALAAASFLAGAALSLVPSTLGLLKEIGLLANAPPGIEQLFGSTYTNEQVLAATTAATLVSIGALARLRMTGFAWTTAALGTSAYLAGLLPLGWLDWTPYRQAMTCLPLVLLEGAALGFERAGRVRWSLPFHLIALITLIGAFDVMAGDGPTLARLGLQPGDYLSEGRLRAFSYAFNGVLFLGLMFLSERAASLDLRRIARVLEMASLLHAEGALFHNALEHRGEPGVRLDVALHLATALGFLVLGAWRGRWRMLVGALGGLALGSYLIVDLGLVARAPFILVLGTIGLLVATGAFFYLLLAPRVSSRKSQARAKVQ